MYCLKMSIICTMVMLCDGICIVFCFLTPLTSITLVCYVIEFDYPIRKMGPVPFSEIGKGARDLLTKDYNFDQKFSLSAFGSSGVGLTATGLKRDEIFFGDLSTVYRSGNTTVDVKVDIYSNVSTKVTVNDILRFSKLSCSFQVPDHKSGKLELQYLHPHATSNLSIGLNPTPPLELSATAGTKELSFGGEVGFDTASATLTKYNAGIEIARPDFSVAVMLADKGQAIKTSYIHSVNPSMSVAAGMINRFSKISSLESIFSLGSCHVVDPSRTVKTRFSNSGKVAMLWQHEWRPKSLVTLSAEYDVKATNASPKLGLALALKP